MKVIYSHPVWDGSFFMHSANFAMQMKMSGSRGILPHNHQSMKGAETCTKKYHLQWIL